jgi:hypothetical protein
MKSPVLKSLLLAAITCATTTACFAYWPYWPAQYAGYWVVGNHATNKCEIVTANPTIDGSRIWFGTGPYNSLDDAKLARSTIRDCPKQPAPNGKPMPNQSR